MPRSSRVVLSMTSSTGSFAVAIVTGIAMHPRRRDDEVATGQKESLMGMRTNLVCFLFDAMHAC
jgi:hypothetical protein